MTASAVAVPFLVFFFTGEGVLVLVGFVWLGSPNQVVVRRRGAATRRQTAHEHTKMCAPLSRFPALHTNTHTRTDTHT